MYECEQKDTQIQTSFLTKGKKVMNWKSLGQFFPYISSDDQAAQLVNDKYIKVRRRLAELLL